MMAFFLLMWLLNATTEEQRKGLAAYFSPSNLMSRASSGSGQPFGGHTPFDQGSMISDRGAVQVIPGRKPAAPEEDENGSVYHQAPQQQLTRPDDSASPTSNNPAPQRDPAREAQIAQDKPLSPANGQESATTAVASGAVAASDVQAADAKARAQREAESRAEQERRERQAFDQAAQQIKEVVRADPALAELAPQLAIDMTPEGLRIQIMDEERRPMFATGSAAPNDRARLLLAKVAPVLLKMSEDISIAGHTDATPYAGQQRTNWELSADRANATRRLLVEAGLPQSRIRNVTGNADRDPLLPADPTAAANRRIAIVVLRAHAAQTPTASAPP
ncbi:MAG: OmpA family protein [Acetobacteraceae bacterium]|nr:OmpA family protein [Acetobacteraceae bacterium]